MCVSLRVKSEFQDAQTQQHRHPVDGQSVFQAPAASGQQSCIGGGCQGRRDERHSKPSPGDCRRQSDPKAERQAQPARPGHSQYDRHGVNAGARVVYSVPQIEEADIAQHQAEQENYIREVKDEVMFQCCFGLDFR